MFFSLRLYLVIGIFHSCKKEGKIKLGDEVLLHKDTFVISIWKVTSVSYANFTSLVSDNAITL